MNRQQRRAAAKAGAPGGGGAAAPGGGLFAEAVRHHRAGRLQAAHAICRQLLALDPGHRDALHLDGLIACQLGAPAEGIALLEKALARGARDPALHANLAEALRSLARLDEAALHYRRAVALAPNFAAAHAGMGHVLLQQGRHDEAAAAYGRALALAPGQAAVLNNLGVALHRLGRLDEAAAAFGQALDADPGHLDALTNRGNLLLALGRGDAALASYERALALNPDHPAALNNRADLLVERGRFAEAAAAFERLLAIAPNYPYALGSLLYARLHRCDWSDFERLAAGAAEAAAAGRPVATPSALVCLSDSAAAQLACARIFAADKHPAAAQPLWRGERYAHQRIRVAYISADFRRHPVGYLVAGLFAAHDRARFAITALSTGPDAKDDLRARFEASAERFVDVRGRSEREVAQLVRELEID
ncbi:MAG TPA: tetratricopeptide repeat protein, partial [Stellaceae bacterium]|nr:tetratricopeptide repeat protein [Stellaceae bacterium]